MSAASDGAITAALIAGAVSVLIFAATQIASLAQRIGAARRARVDAVLDALSAVIIEVRSPRIVRLWSKTQVRLLLTVTEMVGSLPPRDRPLVDFLWLTTHRMSGQPPIRRLAIATAGLAAARVWFGSKRNGRSYMTALLIAAKQESLFGSKLYNVKLPRGVHRPLQRHRRLEVQDLTPPLASGHDA